MTKFIYISIRRYAGLFFILAFAVSAVVYLIMVNVVYSKVGVDYGKLDIPNDYSSFNNFYELHKRAAVDTMNNSRHLSEATTHVTNKVKVILLWSPLFEGWNFLQVGKHSFEESQCPETRCEITDDRRRFLESDAVLFHVRTLSMLDLPKNRTQEQKWVFFSLEAPPYSRFQGFDFMFGMFNWTMTYRKDSDVYIPYGRTVPTNTISFNNSDLYAKWRKKSKMAVWMVSHCSTAGNRERYIKQLKSFLDVDTYGSCGLGTCPFNKTNLCIKNFSKQYYFFLAFENAICDDYITEKLFRTLKYDMIPVVFGGGDYTAMAPPNSFIDALKFLSPRQLSSHLLRVASNFTLFSSFFKWRETAYPDDVPNHCELCRKLHSDDFKRKSVYPNINDWWIRQSRCKKWKA